MDDTSAQERIIEAVVEAYAHDVRLRACWLEGSFARGNADRFSDLDLRAVVADGEAGSVLRDFAALLSSMGPVKHWKRVISDPGESELVAIFANAVMADLHFVTAGVFRAPFVDTQVRVLFDRGLDVAEVSRQRQSSREVADQQANSLQMASALRVFWSHLMYATVAWRRRQPWYAGAMLSLARSILGQLLWFTEQPDRRAVPPRLNALDLRKHLAEGSRQELDGLVPPGEEAALGEALRRAAELMRRHGPQWATQLGCEYPRGLEEVVCRMLEE